MTGPTNYSDPSKISLEAICQKLIPLEGLLYETNIESLTDNIAKLIAPLFSKQEEKPLLFSRELANYGAAKSMAKVLTAWRSQFGVSNVKKVTNAHLPLLRGSVERSLSSGEIPALENIANAEKIYQESGNDSVLVADKRFWNRVKPLVERGIPTEHACFIILYINYPEADLSRLETSNSFLGRDWRYRDLSKIFAQHSYWKLAFQAAKQCSELDADNGANNFVILCRLALRQNDEKNALECQKMAEELNKYTGGKSLLEILKKRMEGEDEPQKALARIQDDLMRLSDLHEEWGRRCLLAVAKKAAEAQKNEMAIEFTKRANWGDIDAYNDMAWHCLKLKQYELSELMARKAYSFGCLLEEIVEGKLADGIVDTRLIDELFTLGRIRESIMLQIISVLFAQEKHGQARQLIIRYFEGLKQFLRDSLIQKLEKRLPHEIKSWLRQADEYARVYSLNDAKDEENISYLVQHSCIDKEALKVYQRHLEAPGVFDLLVETASAKDRDLLSSMLSIEGIGFALNLESLREKAKKALLKLTMMQDTYTSYYILRIQALKELVNRFKEDPAVQEIVKMIIANSQREIIQRETLNLYEGLNGEPQEVFEGAACARMLERLLPTLDQRRTRQQLLYLLSHAGAKMCGPILEKERSRLFESVDKVLKKEETRLAQRTRGLTPLGFADTTWDPLYELLLILGYIGSHTSDYETYSEIQNKICSVFTNKRSLHDAHAAVDALQMLKRNAALKISQNSEKLIKSYEPETSRLDLENRHHAHGHGSEYNSKIELEYEALLDIARTDKESAVTRVLALRRLCAFAISDQRWHPEIQKKNQAWEFLEELNSQELPDLVKKELKRIFSWRT